MPMAGSTPKLVCARSFPWRRSSRLPQHDTFRHVAGVDHAPERDEQLAREGNDHFQLDHALGPLDPASVPPRKGAVLLELGPTPRQLDHGASYPGVAALGKSLLLSFRTALVRRTCQPRTAPDRSAVAQVA